MIFKFQFFKILGGLGDMPYGQTEYDTYDGCRNKVDLDWINNSIL